MSETLTPEIVERAIDEAGRATVFDRARAAGWGTNRHGSPPLWVWYQIAQEIIAERRAA